MYNHHLLTFITVVDAGSFIKAGERLFITPNAVTKQINILEEHLDLKLLNRTHRGVTLTEEGKIIYDGAKKLISESNEIVDAAKALKKSRKNVIRVGFSILHPVDILMERWNQVSKYLPNIELEFIPINDTVDDLLELIEHLGEKIDIIPATTDVTFYKERCNTFDLENLPVMLAIPSTNQLASRELLEPTELADESIIIPELGVNKATDQVFETVTSCCKNNIHFEFVKGYSFEVANKAISENKFMLSNRAYNNIHPMLKNVKVNWDFKQSYGILYPLKPSQEVLSFVMALGRRG